MSAEPTRWQQVQDLFARASELPASLRPGFLAAQCADESLRGEVLELLDHDAGGVTRLRSAVATAALEVASGGVGVGSMAGPWRITGEIGRGGMGMVFAVERADGAYRQKAALKLIRAESRSSDGLRRFLEERDILARLEHPNIARLLDGGNTAEGQPYLVMEYVEGVPITRYCADRKLSVKQRVRLFREVCSAVQAAHARLVVHRDLKPGNILVNADGAVKLLDFGIAKLLDPGRDAQTMTGAALLTPEYASPEQVAGVEVTTSTDVYSLGVVLYEILTGARAHALSSTSPAEIVRVVLEVEPPPPSQAVRDSGDRRDIEGDLDNIIRKAMHKDPSQRYPSAEALSEDLDRYLSERPVRARPDTVRYRVGKLLRRNRWSVAGGIVVAASLVGAAVVSNIQARRAQRRFDEVRALSNRVLFDLHDRIRDLPGSTGARQYVVTTAKGYLDRLAAESVGDPGLQRELAAAYERLGDVLGAPSSPSLGKVKEARESYLRAYQLRSAIGEASRADFVAMTGNYLKRSDGELVNGSVEAAMTLAEEALARSRSSDDWRGVYGALGRRSYLLQTMPGQTQKAKSDVESALEVVEEHGRDWPEYGSAKLFLYLRLAHVQKLLNEYDAALDSLARAEVQGEELLRASPADMHLLASMRSMYNETGDIEGSPFSARGEHLDRALVSFQKALAIARRVRQLDPLSFPALSYELLGEAQVAETTSRAGDVKGLDLQEAVAQHAEEAVRNHPNEQTMKSMRMLTYTSVGWQAGNFGQWRRAMNALDTAVGYLQELTAKDPKRVPGRHRVMLLTQRGRAAVQLGEREKAMRDLAECRKIASAMPKGRLLTMDYRNNGWCFHYSGDAEMRFGSRASAVEHYREALRLWDDAIAKPVPGALLPNERKKTIAALAAAGVRQ